MLEIIQEYSTKDMDWYAYNMFLNDNETVCKIKIHLGSLMDRKNMAFKKLVKKIDSFFLLEFVCAIMRSEDLWKEGTCGDGYDCNIKKILKKLDYFTWKGV